MIAQAIQKVVVDEVLNKAVERACKDVVRALGLEWGLKHASVYCARCRNPLPWTQTTAEQRIQRHGQWRMQRLTQQQQQQLECLGERAWQGQQAMGLPQAVAFYQLLSFLCKDIESLSTSS